MISGFTPGTCCGGPLSQLMRATATAPVSPSPAVGAPHRAAYSDASVSPSDRNAASVARGPVTPQGWYLPRNFLGTV